MNIDIRRFGLAAICALFLASSGAAQNTATYRQFGFGTNAASVAKQAQIDPSRIKTLYKSPNLIQTLQWDRAYSSSSSSTSKPDPASSLRFDFYNDQLFRIVTTYDRRQIEGLTAEDLMESISAQYGRYTKPDESVVVSASDSYEDRQKVIARWEDGDSVYRLFRPTYGGEFGLVSSSTRLDAMATLSILESKRLAALGAPQREVERLQKEAEARRSSEEKARAVNKPNFRP